MILVFNDVAAVILEEENRHNNKGDRINSSYQVETLLMLRGRSMEYGSSVGQRKERSKSRSKKTVKSYNYDIKEHYKRDC